MLRAPRVLTVAKRSIRQPQLCPQLRHIRFPEDHVLARRSNKSIVDKWISPSMPGYMNTVITLWWRYRGYMGSGYLPEAFRQSLDTCNLKMNEAQFPRQLLASCLQWHHPSFFHVSFFSRGMIQAQSGNTQGTHVRQARDEPATVLTVARLAGARFEFQFIPFEKVVWQIKTGPIGLQAGVVFAYVYLAELDDEFRTHCMESSSLWHFTEILRWLHR